MGAKSSVATDRRPSAPKGKRRSFSVGRKGTESQSAWVPPSPEEATLVQRLAPGTSPREGPPYYAIAESWLSIWRVFALEGGIRPGPIENDKLLNTSRSQDICWLSAADWHSLYGRYGGGPILCRHTKQLFVSTQPVNAAEGEMPASVRATSSRGLLEELSPRSGSASSSSPEALLRKACNALTWKCRDIETSLRDEVERLENGSWRAKPPKAQAPKAQAPKAQASKAIVAARQRVCQAVKATCGGEELKSALQDLASINRDDPELRGLEAKVYDLCAHEEAQIVLVILLQAVQEADRLGLEMWLEEARGVELLVGNMDIYEPLRKTLSELEEREKRALAGHAATTENDEEPAERLWRQVQFAVEANDEDTLMMLIEEAQERGIDASVAWMAWEELRHRREEAEGHSTIPPPPRPRAGTSSPSAQPDDTRHKSRGTIPGNAPRRGSAWHQQQEDIDDDFLNRYKKWRADQRAEREASQSSYRPFSQADREGDSEAEASRARVEAERRRVREAEARRRQEREEEEEERRQQEEESKRRAAFEAEREQRRRRQRFNQTTPPSGQPQNRGFAPSQGSQDGQGRAKSLTDEMEAQLRQTRYQPLETRKRVFKDLQLRLHPDKNPDNPQAAKTAFQALMEKRQEYLAP